MATLDEVMEAARARLDRVTVDRLADEMAAGALLIDIRPVEQRRREGELPGAVAVERNVLEWRFAGEGDARTFDVAPGQKVIVMCSEGYQSSLAAALLMDLGVEGATDLVGGYQAWLASHR